MLADISLRSLLLLAGYPRFASKLAGPHQELGVLRTRLPGTVGCQITYPAAAAAAAAAHPRKPLPYFRAATLGGLAHYTRMSRFLFGVLGARRHPAIHAAPAATRDGGADGRGARFPLIVFSHGLGGCMEMYSQLCRHLASCGYIVLALEHEDGSGCYAEAADGSPIWHERPDDTPYSRDKVLRFRTPMLKQRAADIEAVLEYLQCDQTAAEDPALADPALAAVLDAADRREGAAMLVGHSFGGAAVTLAAQLSASRVCAVVLLDVWAFSLADETLDCGLSVPCASAISQSWTTSKELPQINRLLEASGPNLRGSYFVKSTCHQSFSDTPNWLPGAAMRKLRMRGEGEPLHLAHQAVAELCAALHKQASRGDEGEGFVRVVAAALESGLSAESRECLERFPPESGASARTEAGAEATATPVAVPCES